MALSGVDARIVVVGASLAGLRASQALRREGFAGRLALVGDEGVPPYDRPPLSKEVLAGTYSSDNCRLADLRQLEELRIEPLLGTPATALDLQRKVVELSDGTALTYDGLIIATGARARMLPGLAPLVGVHALRTIRDAEAIRAGLGGSPRVVIVGGGFIGCEVAAAVRGLGLAVTLVHRGPHLMDNAIGALAGAYLLDLHRSFGVEVHCGLDVVAVAGRERVEEVVLSDGRRLPADLVVVGVGAQPNDEWLAGSGLTVAGGVVADRYCMAAPGVAVAGDVARWAHPWFGDTVRVEHWGNADEQGAAAAVNLLRPDRPTAFGPVPYVWSHQHGSALHMFGHRAPGGEEVVLDAGSPDEPGFAVLYGDRGVLTGALGLNRGGRLRRYRKLLSAPTELSVAAAS